MSTEERRGNVPIHPIVLLGTFVVLMGMVGAMVGVAVVGPELGLEARTMSRVMLAVAVLVPAHMGLFVAAVFMRLAFDQRRKMVVFVGAGALATLLVALPLVDASSYQAQVELKMLDEKEAAGEIILTDPTTVEAQAPLGEGIDVPVSDVPRTSPTSRDILEDRYVKPLLK